MSQPSPVNLLERRRWVVPLLVLVLAVVAFVGYVVGRDARVVTEEVGCLSAEGVIGCTLSDGWEIAVPLDVAWTDTAGSFHQGGRPECLPPTGRGLEGPVRISWTKVEVDGTGWRQVLKVACLD